MKKIIATVALIATTSLFANGGDVLYKKCAGCHGVKAEKVALGKSKIVADMSKDDIVKALQGYKAGTYGGPMKGIMRGQVASLEDKDIEALAEHIVTNK
ncbi:MAG: c-type cytochrome [Arcobacteraceae bacterium]|nr:c-type cytochrome [Arcobacteraceae bacterium]